VVLSDRSNRQAVRNPMLQDENLRHEVLFLGPNERAFLERFLRRASKRWAAQADHAWRKHKPPMAAYWKQCAVNARHLALAIRTLSPPSI
jgi:hypothetical protein